MIDSHCHLFLLKHDALSNIVDRQRAAGVRDWISVATDPKSWDENFQAVAQWGGRSSLGIHPHEAVRYTDGEQLLEAALEERPRHCVAIGETGLDYSRDTNPELQKELFRSHVRLSHRFELPLIIHCRDAFSDLYAILDEEGIGPRSGVLHCFTGTLEEAEQGIQRGLRVSFSGIVTFRNASALREVARALSPQSVLIETDCPFLAPEPYRGKPNEPSYLRHTLQCLADLWGMTTDEADRMIERNTIELFQL